jgi:hypothetical protein
VVEAVWSSITRPFPHTGTISLAEITADGTTFKESII